jgi:hypothetical protein
MMIRLPQMTAPSFLQGTVCPPRGNARDIPRATANLPRHALNSRTLIPIEHCWIIAVLVWRNKDPYSKSGILILFPLFIADWCAHIPAQV